MNLDKYIIKIATLNDNDLSVLPVPRVKEFIKKLNGEIEMLINEELTIHKNHRLVTILKSLNTTIKNEAGKDLVEEAQK